MITCRWSWGRVRGCVMRVRIDRGKCQAHNRCHMACPEVYKTDEEGYAYVENEEVPGPLKDKARRGAEACPEHAVVVME